MQRLAARSSRAAGWFAALAITVLLVGSDKGAAQTPGAANPTAAAPPAGRSAPPTPSPSPPPGPIAAPIDVAPDHAGSGPGSLIYGGGRGRGGSPPGEPPALGRPRPGSMFDPGATGPGISRSRNEVFLDGALDPKTGWPLVFLDHFRPRAERVGQFWIVQTRECPQEMGTDPWPNLRVLHFNADGELEPRDPQELFAQVANRPTLVQVQGSLTTPDIALGGMLWTHTWLTYMNAMLPETVVVAFDWPSQRVYRSDFRDINEKGRRAYIAGYHLARFLQAFPPGSRVTLLGQSYGGRVVPSALHLLGGGALNSQAHDPDVSLPMLRPDLQLRAIIIAGASDHFWLTPGARLGHTLAGCDAFLNLYNRRDESLRFYPFLMRSDHHRALGRIGMTNADFARIGPLASRYAEHDVHDLLGREHTLLDAVANPRIAQMMAPYLWNPCPAPPPNQTPTEDAPNDRVRVGRILR